MKRTLYLVAVCLLQPASAQQYTVTEIPGLLAARHTSVTEVNRLGQAVGYSQLTDGRIRAFIWDRGVTTDLGSLGGPITFSAAINDAGQIVGYSQTTNRRYHAFLWSTGGGMVDLFPASGDSFADDINENGQIVGGHNAEAFLWDDGVLTGLGRLYNGVSHAYGVNDRMQIVGTETPERSEFRFPFIWENGRMEPLSGGRAHWALRINNLGQIVGGRWSYININDQPRAVTWISRNLMYLPELSASTGIRAGIGSWASGINDNGDIVGYSHDGEHRFHAALWRDLEVVDLNTLIPAGSGWELWSATSISNNGLIAGHGSMNGGPETGFLLTPVPEPASLIGTVLALVALVHRRRRT